MRKLIATAAVAGICIFAAGCHSQPNQSPKASTTTSTTITKAPPPVAEGALPGLLLAPEQINAAMGATDMKVTNSRTAMSDDSATMTPTECLAIDGSAQAQVYANSGFIAERDQTLDLQEGDNLTHFAEQAVVLFPTAKQASAFFTASAAQWQACHDYTHIQSKTQWTVGAISNTNNVLSTVTTLQNPPSTGWKACGRALAVKNNVIVDVNTCSVDPKNSAVDIANQITAKVPA
jgi:PknH-like extracellular domain